MSDAKRTVGTPHDRLTRLCDAMIDTLDAHPERGDEKVIIFLASASERRNGVVLHGYESDTEAMVDLILHLKAIFEANGKEFHFGALQKGQG